MTMYDIDYTGIFLENKFK